MNEPVNLWKWDHVWEREIISTRSSQSRFFPVGWWVPSEEMRAGSWGASSNTEVEQKWNFRSGQLRAEDWGRSHLILPAGVLIQPCFSTSTLAFWSWLNLLCLFIYLFDWTNHGQRGLWVKLVKFECFRSAVDKKTDTAKSQRDRWTEALRFLPSGDSSWTYVPVRYLWTSADLPLARLPTMPWDVGIDKVRERHL